MVFCIIAGSRAVSAQRILFIGDSVTDGGWGNSGGSARSSDKRNHWDLNHIYGHSYMMLCASELQSRYPEKGYKFYNRGISGDDISRLSNRWQADAESLHPDVLSLLEGTNDVLYYLDSIAQGTITKPFDMDGWERNYRLLVSRSRQSNPQLVILLGTPFVAKVGKVGGRSDYAMRDSLVNEMCRRIRQIGIDCGATVVDYAKMFKSLSDTYPSVPASYWIWDGIHPSPAGHRRMADAWIAAFSGH